MDQLSDYLYILSVDSPDEVITYSDIMSIINDLYDVKEIADESTINNIINEIDSIIDPSETYVISEVIDLL